MCSDLRAVAEALAAAEIKHEQELQQADFQFQKRIAAKMVEMVEANAAKQANAVAAATEAARKKVSIVVS